jgi:hypothetical protein
MMKILMKVRKMSPLVGARVGVRRILDNDCGRQDFTVSILDLETPDQTLCSVNALMRILVALICSQMAVTGLLYKLTDKLEIHQEWEAMEIQLENHDGLVEESIKVTSNDEAEQMVKKEE